MTDTKKSCSVEQQMAEDEMFRLIEKELGCDVDRNVRVTMDKNRSVHIEPDFYSEEHGIIGEIFAHIGRNKRGQTKCFYWKRTEEGHFIKLSLSVTGRKKKR